MAWRACGISYVRYAAEMAELLRKSVRSCECQAKDSITWWCVKEPYRTQLQNKNQIHFKEAIYKQGTVVSRQTYDKLKAAFEACETAAPKKGE